VSGLTPFGIVATQFVFAFTYVTNSRSVVKFRVAKVKSKLSAVDAGVLVTDDVSFVAKPLAPTILAVAAETFIISTEVAEACCCVVNPCPVAKTTAVGSAVSCDAISR
jgi:hypothetical protein